MFCGYVKEFYSKNIDRKFKQSNLKVRYGNKEEIKMFESGNKDKKIYILGSSGYLGGLCLEYMKSRGYTVFHERIELSDFSALTTMFNKIKPDVVINCAGAKAYPTVDWCEDHKEETALVNVVGAINAMTAALSCGAYPIQICSGCIYQGGKRKVFTEEDKPNFYGSFYSRMRVVMQDALKELPVLQARIRMPLSSIPHKRNFINKIAGYNRVISIPNSVTYLDDLWPALEVLMEKKPTGILNLTNDGYIDNGHVLEAYKKIIDPTHTYEIISLLALHGPGGITKAKRSNCVLSNVKAKELGIIMPALNKKRLEEILRKYKENLNNKVL